MYNNSDNLFVPIRPYSATTSRHSQLTAVQFVASTNSLISSQQFQVGVQRSNQRRSTSFSQPILFRHCPYQPQTSLLTCQPQTNLLTCQPQTNMLTCQSQTSLLTCKPSVCSCVNISCDIVKSWAVVYRLSM